MDAARTLEKGGIDMMQNMGGFIGGLGYLSISLGFIKSILEVLLYISAIIVSFKAVQALNIYINKNSR
ncbi:MAG: hypothetical protein AAGU75_16610 [Bacillota bacterium]